LIQFFAAWVAIAFIYFWVALVIGCIFPIFDGGWQKVLIVLRGVRTKVATTQLTNSLELPEDQNESTTSAEKI